VAKASTLTVVEVYLLVVLAVKLEDCTVGLEVTYIYKIIFSAVVILSCTGSDT